MVEQLGIVYTPVEVVDFIIHSVNDILKKEFGRSIADENVHVLDPFTGTGTFITRLLQSGLIPEKDLERKYRHELHANEIVLLAYYIAAVNIENAFHDATLDPDDGIGKEKYIPFDGIVLTDTFQLGETDASEKMFSEMFPQNSDRVERQKKAPLRVIIGNPPYSVGQKSENDNAKNQEYLKLDKKIASTYVASSNTTMNKALYDAYIKAFRWSSDRLDENGGIICFVSNGAWIDGNSTSGFRKSLEKEFSSIYVFNLRGNARTSGELRQKEAGNVFGSGSRTPISITLLVKNPKAKNEKAIINYYDIGDYLSREEKLTIISNFKSGGGDTFPWKQLIPNKEGDWISQRNNLFETFIPIASKDKKENCFFNINTNGVVTSRDAWVCNFSKEELSSKMKSTIDFYNSHLLDFQTEKIKNIDINLEEYIDTDAKKISWSRALKQAFNSGKKREFYDSSIVKSSYRPFIKEFFYFNRDFNECVYQQPTLYPSNSSKNIVINAIGLGSSKEYSTLISDSVLSYDFLEKAQCFPLYFY
jgi:predicted helicase